ncbi:hypothetical protein SCP_0206560 [Sparassis crispa]|uniref:MARVEL domain-containing protein n=1 Tax=Sparassis crispa TaxID=139825 RepID=A0A401GB91_9APHY|nr:hypothetical protein SCP_0206560 [Sparassis crispa]GBE79456.1 hypothetical protein SCP_0206560 [Sparassis crispa]
MPSVFNVIRTCVYVAVLLWSVICLAIAGHFQSILVSSDLTRFVPFAIFVCSASLLIILALLGFGLWKERNPISTRIELGCLALAGVLWTALGAFVASSDSEEADVECYSAQNELVAVPGFNTETFHAQYHVLEAFSFFNMILIWGFLLFLLVLALRQHSMGEKGVWVSSVTAFPWFGRGKQSRGLPPPVISRSKSRSRGTRAATSRIPERKQSEKRAPEKKAPIQLELEKKHPYPEQPARRIHLGHHEPSRNESPTYVYWIPHQTPDQAHVRDHRSRDRYQKDTLPRR